VDSARSRSQRSRHHVERNSGWLSRQKTRWAGFSVLEQRWGPPPPERFDTQRADIWYQETAAAQDRHPPPKASPSLDAPRAQ